MEIFWTERYSSTDEPDHLNRWARVGYLKSNKKDSIFDMQEIAWISKKDNIYVAYIYIGRGKFEKGLTSLEEAKAYCSKIIEEFVQEYLITN